ncbi:helix-turn-helix domain-containing protein [Plantactinospora sp. CA-290183]|uniref:helix-turn-helix domain-containing protein n=1 Tax=Plantactinospora sp. CA-290183 TaxID=3240006 RepID=UPI003D90B3DB
MPNNPPPESRLSLLGRYEPPSPTLARRFLGRCLEELRLQRGLRRAAAARTVNWSGKWLGSHEAGVARITPETIAALCRRYRADEAQTTELRELAKRAANVQDWWNEYPSSVLTREYCTYLGLEDAALQQRRYAPNLIPEPLRTRDYHRATLSGIATQPHIQLGLQQAQQRHTQILVRNNPPSLNLVIGERALYRQVGTPDAMARQLRHLLSIAALPHVQLQILPEDVNDGEAPPYALLELPEPEPPALHWQRREGRWFLSSKPAHIDQFTKTFERIQHVALTTQESLDAISCAARKWHPVATSHTPKAQFPPNISRMVDLASDRRSARRTSRRGSDPLW